MTNKHVRLVGVTIKKKNYAGGVATIYEIYPILLEMVCKRRRTPWRKIRQSLREVNQYFFKNNTD